MGPKSGAPPKISICLDPSKPTPKGAPKNHTHTHSHTCWCPGIFETGLAASQSESLQAAGYAPQAGPLSQPSNVIVLKQHRLWGGLMHGSLQFVVFFFFGGWGGGG